MIEPLTREQVPVISAVSSPITGTTESFVPEYSGTKTGTITGTKSVIPTGKQEQQLLQFLLQQQLQHDELRTPLLSRDKISEDTKIPLGNVKIVISRLVEKGAIARVDVSKSRSAGGTSFSISRAVRRSLQELITGTKTGTKTGTSQTLVSSSSLNTTTTDKDRSELFQNACERYGLHDTGIGANDLLQIWRKGVFQTEEDFITSMEHIAFYLGTVEAKTLTHPKAWVTSQLTKGFYPAPVGFKSCEELQQEARLSAKRERLARLEELKRQELEADFELWAAELDDDEKRRRLAGTPFAEQPNSKLGRTILREQFIQQNGGELGATI